MDASLKTEDSLGTIDVSIATVKIVEDEQYVAKYVKQYARHHLSVLLLNPGVKLFSLAGTNSSIGFSQHKKCIISLGGLMGDEQHRERLIIEFLEWCKDKKYKPMFLHFQRSDAVLFNRHGCKTNQVGACYSIDLNKYSMAGKKFQQLRYKMNKAEKRGVQVREILDNNEFETLKPILLDINQSWQAKKKAKPIRIMVTNFDSISLSEGDHRLFIATYEEDVISYILYSRTYGNDSGWFHNLSRYRKDAPDGSMQLINKFFLQSFDNEEDKKYLHFGFTPLVDMGNEVGGGSTGFTKIAEFLSKKGGVVYPARSQRQYKMSWRPTHIEPEYFSYSSGALPAIINLLMATNSI